MSPWVGVHGIGQQYNSREEILRRWKSALSGGIEWAAQRRVQPDLDVAYYGYLFRKTEPPKTGKGAASSNAVEDLADLDEAEIADLTAAVDEIVTPGDLAAASYAKGMSRLPVSVVTRMGALERRFPRASGALVMKSLRQVRSYLVDPQLKAQVDRVTAAAADGATVLIGHSLGSVVAYEFLRQHPGHSVRLLVTLGSPLGFQLVRSRLSTAEPGVERWVNVRDPHDPVTGPGALDRWYPAALDGYVDNGLQAHQAERYLNCKATGEALVDFLPGTGQ